MANKDLAALHPPHPPGQEGVEGEVGDNGVDGEMLGLFEAERVIVIEGGGADGASREADREPDIDEEVGLLEA